MQSWYNGRRNRDRCPRKKDDWIFGENYKRKECEYKSKKWLRDNIVLPALSYECELWTWNGAHSSKVQAAEICFRGARSVSRWERLINEVYERCRMIK